MSIENLLQQIKEAKVSQKQTNIKVSHLISDFKDDNIIIPEYQRQFVWDNSIQSRFIESIFMAIPIPSIFFLETIDDETGMTKNEVIDGVQRLSTLVAFTDNKLKLSKGLKLTGLEGQKFETLPHPITQQFLNRDISIITIEKNTDATIQFEIFERLNRGSVSLSHQELRNCMYHGQFNSFLNRISENKDYKDLLIPFSNLKEAENSKPDRSRMLDVEMILRFFYLLESYYESPLNRLTYPKKEQLNFYMRAKKEQEKGNEDYKDSYTKSNEELEDIFNKVCKMIKLTFKNNHYRKFSISKNKASFTRSFNKAFFDIQMLGFIDYKIEDIVKITDIIYSEFIEVCCFNPVMMDNTNDKITERINIWKEHILDIVTDDNNYYINKLERKIEHFNRSPICYSCNENIEILDEGYSDIENNTFYHINCYVKENKKPTKKIRNRYYFNNVDDDVEIFIASKGIKAMALITKNGIIVKAGSEAVLEAVSTNSCRSELRSQKKLLIDSGELIDNGNFLVFKNDTVFTSFSNSASFILGSMVNGKDYWKTLDGKTINELGY